MVWLDCVEVILFGGRNEYFSPIADTVVVRFGEYISVQAISLVSNVRVRNLTKEVKMNVVIGDCDERQIDNLRLEILMKSVI